MKYVDVKGIKPQIFIMFKNKFENGEEFVSLKNGDESLGVYIKCPVPFKYVKLVWNAPILSDGDLISGDEFERGYGKFCYSKPQADQNLFWYFFATDKVSSIAYGVKTGCSSIAIWQTDGNTIELKLDCRNGFLPVKLGDRMLHACDVICSSSIVA